MTTNILRAIMNIKKRIDNSLLNIYVIPKINPSTVNRANNVGEALEFYMRDAFCDTFSEKDVQKKKIGLVDDVATTRTTLSLACEVLKKAGAKEVWGVVLAHSF